VETKRFWIAVSAVLSATLVGIFLVEPTTYRWPVPVAAKVAIAVLMGILVAVIWAIVFRAQIVSGRVSLGSLFVLTLMEAILLVAIRTFRPF
jgi:hypothetical protein